MEKIFARTFSYLFHPLVMTTLILVILFNSGTSLSVLQPEVKKIALSVTILFTFVFPASMIIILYISRLIESVELQERKDRNLVLSLSLIIYLVLFFILRGIPQLSAGHVVFLSCPLIVVLFVLVLNRIMNPSIHMLAVGMLVAVILMLILVFGSPLQLLFILSLLSAGILGTSRLVLRMHSPREVLTGFGMGFFITLTVLLTFVFTVMTR